jgi:hypothetical protein
MFLRDARFPQGGNLLSTSWQAGARSRQGGKRPSKTSCGFFMPEVVKVLPNQLYVKN